MDFAEPQTQETGEASDRGELGQIDELKRGLSPFFDQLAGLAASAQKIFNSSALTPEIRTKLQEVRQELDRSIMRFGAACKEAQMNVSEDNLARHASREYHNYFKEEISEHRLGLVRLAKMYGFLKTFQIEADEILHRIVRFIKKSEVPPESDFSKQLLNYRIAPAMRSNEGLRIYCTRLSILLGMVEEPSSFKSLSDSVRYAPDIQYTFSSVFVADIREYVRGLLPEDSALPSLPEIKKKRFELPKGVPEQPHILDAGGEVPWNRGTHYYFTYDPAKLAEERTVFASVVYIDTHMGADADFLKGSVIRNFARKEQAIESAEAEELYTSFLMTYFDLVVEISMLSLSIPHDLKNLFLFHLGPLSFFYLTRRFLQEAGTGTMHLKSGRSMIKKYMPTELIKKAVLEWWRNRVLPGAGPERNDPNQFNRLARAIRKAHGDLRDSAEKKYQALSEDIRRGRLRSEVYREHLNDWFGATNIIVFRRFLKATE